MKIYTKESLIKRLAEIKKMGWIPNARPGNVGGVGNTLEDLLDIQENNLPIPNAAEWELKCQRIGTASLTTLFHMEPSPTALRIVPNLLLPKYGWRHQTIPDEKSFRQTINATARSDRGFRVVVDRDAQKVFISFDASKVSPRHNEWLKSVEENVRFGELNPQPYWGFKDLCHKAGSKLHNCFYVQAAVKRESRKEYFRYEKVSVIKNFSCENFIKAIELGFVLVDFDARTHHNHGTKFRLIQDHLPDLYTEKVEVVS